MFKCQKSRLAFVDVCFDTLTVCEQKQKALSLYGFLKIWTDFREGERETEWVSDMACVEIAVSLLALKASIEKLLYACWCSPVTPWIHVVTLRATPNASRRQRRPPWWKITRTWLSFLNAILPVPLLLSDDSTFPASTSATYTYWVSIKTPLFMNTPPPFLIYVEIFFFLLRICARRGSQKTRLPLHARLADVCREEPKGECMPRCYRRT